MTVTMLGTGTPQPLAARFGSAILVDAGGQLLLFDCGRGATIRLWQTEATAPARLRHLFLTHLHSDHVVGLPDLYLTGWLLGRVEPLQVWGPEGTAGLASHLFQAFEADRLSRQGSEENLPIRGAELQHQVVAPGVVFDDHGARVIAFRVDHGHIVEAFGYRVEYGGHSVVISGDSRVSESLIKAAVDTDLLIHSAWMSEARNPTPAPLRSIASAEEAGQIFARVKPGLAAVYHYADARGLVRAIRRSYRGPLVIGRDLMAIEIGTRTRIVKSSGNAR
jgi:ribonuclease Z